MNWRPTHALIAYGPALIATLYLLAGSAWLHYGHWPRPCIDDPADAGVLAQLLLILVFVQLVIAPPVITCNVGFSLLWSTERGQLPRRILESLAGLVLTASAFYYMYCDPHIIMGWLMD